MPIAPLFVNTPAVVLKRQPLRDSDQLVTLFTQARGKLTCVVKGIRKLKSRKKSIVEPGNLIQAYILESYQRPILSECQLISSLAPQHHSLNKLTQLQEVLEIIDRLTVNYQEDPEVFEGVANILSHLHTAPTSVRLVRDQLSDLLSQLGYNRLEDSSFSSIMEYVGFLSDKPMRSVAYLTVPNSTI